MNYQKIYENLISKAKSENRIKLKRNDPNFIYYENHHILPSCLGGKKNKENLVLLTGKEHFVAHKLLTEIYSQNKKLFVAVHKMMVCKNRFQERNYIVSAKEYERVRIEFSQYLSLLKTGKKGFYVTSEYTKKLLSQRMTGKKRSEETKQKLRDRIISESTRIKHSINAKNRKVSEETRKLFSIKNSGSGNPMYGKGYKLKGDKNGRYGKEVTEETRKKISISNMGKPKSEKSLRISRENFSGSKNPMYNSQRFGEKNPFFGEHHSEETIRILREKAKNREKIECPYCHKMAIKQNAIRWHFDNCKNKPK